MTPEELEAERLRLQAEASTNPMMQPTNLMGQQAPQEDVNPLALAGLGGAAFLGQNLPAGGVNPQVTGPVSQGLFQSSNIIGRNLPAGGANPQVTGPVSQGSLRPAPNQPVLMGQPQSYQGVPTGPNTPPQFTGNAPARPIPGTQLAPPNQPPAVSSAGGAPANTARPMKAAQRVGPPATIAGGAAATGLLARLNPYVAAATGGYLGGKAIDAFGGDALRAVGLTDREGNISDMLGSSIGETMYGDGNLPAFSEEELLAMQGEPEANLPQMSRLGDEPLSFTQPTGPSSTTAQAAQLAATLPDDAGLMGAPGVQGTGIPTTTLDIDGGSATVPQALADQTFQGIGSAPMSIEETRARLGGRTLNEYLNAPDGTEGVYGLRTDPQGRMIPAGFDTRADAYGSYEMDAAAREARQDARPDFGAAISDRERRGTGEMSMADATDMFGSSEAGRAAILRQRQGLNPVTGNREKTDAERAQSEQQGQLQNEVLQARLDSFKQTDPDKLSKAQAYAERLGLTGDSATAFIFSQMGTSMDDIFGLEGTGAGGGAANVFNTVEEAEAANLPIGTTVTIDGQKAIIE